VSILYAPVISGAVEGQVDEAVLKQLVTHVGAALGPIHGKNGKHALLQRLPGYNAAAQWSPWAVLVDLNQHAACAPPVRQTWLPHPTPGMCFRIVVREIEAWLLADSARLARFLRIPATRIPPNPEALPNPKQTMVNLARGSRRRDIREDMVPRPRSGREVGPAYTSRLIEFAESHWRPGVAARRADSLRRSLRRLRQLTTRVP